MRFSIVKNKNGQVPPQSSCDFLPPGGTIGRSVDNNLVLPDEERSISRLQAIVHISAGGECCITNRGNVTNVQLNNIPLERGRQVELQDGDILGIDDYQIQVGELQQATVPTPTCEMAHRIDSEPVAVTAPPQQDTAAVPSEIWDNLVQEFTSGTSATTPTPYNDNNHPLLEESQTELNSNNPLEQLTNNLDLHNLQSRQTDPATLFNANTPFDREHILADTTPSALLADHHIPTNIRETAPLVENNADEKELDPLALFGSSSQPIAPGSHNNSDPLGLLISGAEPLAEVTLPSVPQPTSPVPEPMLPTTPLSPAPDSVTEPEYPKDHTPKVSAQSRARSANRLGIDPVNYSVEKPQNIRASSREIEEGPLLNALLQGLGLDDLQPQPYVDEQQLYLAGRLLSLFSQGTVALLSSRSILKRGVKAEMTMILDEANNPFKLLPSGKTVLMQIFGSKMPGFMPPEQSVRDALIDLQAHQLGMIAGIRAIIAAMLQSFNPESLEDKARQEGEIPRLTLPSSRKAALWEYFVKRYQKTAGELEDDFHTLFGEAFLHAYGVEVNQYKDSQTKPDDQ